MHFRATLLALAATAISTFGQQPDAPGLSLGQAPRSGDLDAAATVVVYNESDPDSTALAKFYAGKRGIPAERVVGLTCSTREEITRQEYDETIAEPLRKVFLSHFWWKLREPESKQGAVESNHIRFMAVMRGVPLKIAPVDAYVGDHPSDATPIGTHNEAAVDSELSILGLRSKLISGAMINPFYRSLTSIRDANRPDIMLVCRLDGPTAAGVRRRIEESLATEQTGLHGMAYVDARGVTSEPGLMEGDQWLLGAAQDLRRHGVPVILDNGPALFPEGYPMRYAALYFGWYAERLTGPFARPGFRFLPGAIAVHIHSFSASTLRDPHANWAAPLLEAGAAATLGNVYEPYLSLTPHLDVFEERLRLGFTFAESAYASERVVSWMTTFVGDPLYRPFPPVPATPVTKGSAEWEAYKAGSLKWLEDAKTGAAELQASARKLRSGIVWEGLALLQMGANDRPGSIESLEQARKTYSNPDDILRATIHQVIQLRADGKETDAVLLVRKAAAASPNAPAVGVLKMLVPAAFPPPAPAKK